MTTYDRGDAAINDSELYEELLEKRGLTEIKQYRTKTFSYTFKDQEVQCHRHHWSHGDRYHKLASVYYGDFRLWWVIAMFNRKPSEASIEYGDKILIPVDHRTITDAI